MRADWYTPLYRIGWILLLGGLAWYFLVGIINLVFRGNWGRSALGTAAVGIGILLVIIFPVTMCLGTLIQPLVENSLLLMILAAVILLALTFLVAGWVLRFVRRIMTGQK